MRIEGIMKSLPHRYPFLLIDRVTEFEPLKRVVALKNVTINEPFFQGHYPDFPIMPGVLIIECMAQAAGLLLMDDKEEGPARAILFMAVDKARLRRPVVPGDQIELEAEMIRFRSGVAKVRAVARVDGNVAAEAQLMAKVMDS
ncbi:MAG: 3-hydroxyacyl-ACP dehydratase FabZ [Longimicrobiales bacterium]